MSKNLVLFIGFLSILLSFRFFFFYHNQTKYKDGQEVSFEATLLSEPKVFSNYQSFSANLASGQKVFVKVPKYPQFHYSDSMRISGSLKQLVINKKKIGLTMNFPKIEAIKKDKNLFLAVIGFIRQKVIWLFSKTLSSTSSSLLLGIVFGIKESMPSEFADNLKQAGVMHVVAASGMNVAIVGGFLSSIFSLFLKRQIAVAFCIAGILFYALLSGFEASIVRAAIMGILVFSAQILGRQTLAVYGLCLAGFVMVFVDPTIIFDIGFQLSFTATLGILYIKPLLDRIKIRILGENLFTTIAAQAATLPILLANFGVYSLWSIVVNGLVLWTIPILMVIGGVGAIIGFIFAPFGSLILYFSIPLLLYFEKTVDIFAGIGGMFEINEIPWQIILGYYTILASLILFFKKHLVKNDK